MAIKIKIKKGDTVKVIAGSNKGSEGQVLSVLRQVNKAIVEGNTKFEAAELMATDLRASVSLILAALTAKGKSVINRIYHLDRGYEDIEKKLKKVGANIKRVK